MTRANDYLSSYKKFSAKKGNASARVKAHWCPLPPNEVKINVHAAFLTNSNIVDLGLVVRDGDGAMQLAMARTLLQDCFVVYGAC